MTRRGSNLSDQFAERNIVADGSHDGYFSFGVGRCFGYGRDVNPSQEPAAIGSDAGTGSSRKTGRAAGAAEELELASPCEQSVIVNRLDNNGRSHLIDSRVNQKDQHAE